MQVLAYIATPVHKQVRTSVVLGSGVKLEKAGGRISVEQTLLAPAGTLAEALGVGPEAAERKLAADKSCSA